MGVGVSDRVTVFGNFGFRPAIRWRALTGGSLQVRSRRSRGLVHPGDGMGGGADCVPVARWIRLDAMAVPPCPDGKARSRHCLLLSLASLLLRGGERVMMMQPNARFGDQPVRSGQACHRTGQSQRRSGPPPEVRLPRHGTVVLFSDFLSPLDEIRALIGRFAAVPVTGYLLQLLDPAETALPYEGRVTLPWPGE